GEGGGGVGGGERAQKLAGVERHRPVAVAMGIVCPAQRHLPVLECQQAAIGDRHALGIAREILQHRPRAAAGWFRIPHPVRGPKGMQELLPPRVLREGGQRPSNVRAPAVYACWSPVRNRRRNTRLRTRTGRQKVGRQARHCAPSGDSPPPGPPQGTWGWWCNVCPQVWSTASNPRSAPRWCGARATVRLVSATAGKRRVYSTRGLWSASGLRRCGRGNTPWT